MEEADFVSQPLPVLGGDIGGTHSRFAVALVRPNAPPVIEYQAEYLNAHFLSLEKVIARFVQDAGLTSVSGHCLCLAVAGPVIESKSRLTNIDWSVDVESLQAKFGFARVQLVNDLEALAYGVDCLCEKDIQRLNKIESTPEGVRLVTGVGTGLGLAWSVFHNRELMVFPSEGGHQGFAPADVRQAALLQTFIEKGELVSWESLLSGSGLTHLWDFCTGKTETSNISPEKITAAAASGNKYACKAIELFWDCQATWVANLCLLFRPTRGVYLAGGVTKRLLPWLDKTRFATLALAQGTMSRKLMPVPLVLVLNEQCGLLGALAVGANK